MPLKTPELTKFTTTGQGLVNFTSTDLISRTGFEQYSLYNTRTNTGGLTYHLTNESNIWSESVDSFSGNASGTFVKVIDLDFDLETFKSAQTIKGTATALISGAIIAGTAYFKVIIKKEDVEIVSVRSIDTGVSKPRFIMPLVIPETLFEEGSKLRVTIEVWHKDQTGNSVGLGHDPANRDGTTINFINS